VTHEKQVGILTKAVSGLFADKELTKAERNEILAEVFADYRARTGRDGLEDIAAIRDAVDEGAVVLKQLDRQELAMVLLQGKAAQLRKVRPELSIDQAIAKVYEDPANAELAQIERAASRYAEASRGSGTPRRTRGDQGEG
jgi:hypothetical protein